MPGTISSLPRSHHVAVFRVSGWGVRLRMMETRTTAIGQSEGFPHFPSTKRIPIQRTDSKTHLLRYCRSAVLCTHAGAESLLSYCSVICAGCLITAPPQTLSVWHVVWASSTWHFVAARGPHGNEVLTERPRTRRERVHARECICVRLLASADEQGVLTHKRAHNAVVIARRNGMVSRRSQFLNLLSLYLSQCGWSSWNLEGALGCKILLLVSLRTYFCAGRLPLPTSMVLPSPKLAYSRPKCVWDAALLLFSRKIFLARNRQQYPRIAGCKCTSHPAKLITCYRTCSQNPHFPPH